jgi:Protein of unknown function (DUF2934)
MSELSKFDELRMKTGRQLVELVNHELDLGICEARQALSSADNGAFSEDQYLKAKRAYAEASRLIPLVDEVPEDERGRWKARLEHLQKMLEGLSVLGSTPTPNAIPALAHGLWKARGCPVGSPEDDWFRAERVLKSQRELHAVCS